MVVAGTPLLRNTLAALLVGQNRQGPAVFARAGLIVSRHNVQPRIFQRMIQLRQKQGFARSGLANDSGDIVFALARRGHDPIGQIHARRAQNLTDGIIGLGLIFGIGNWRLTCLCLANGLPWGQSYCARSDAGSKLIAPGGSFTTQPQGSLQSSAARGGALAPIRTYCPADAHCGAFSYALPADRSNQRFQTSKG